MCDFFQYVWDYQINSDSVTFSRTSSDGEEGYPGNLTIQATYGLNDDNEIHFNVTATTDKATIISASFKDSSVVGQNYQRAHQGCS